MLSLWFILDVLSVLWLDTGKLLSNMYFERPKLQKVLNHCKNTFYFVRHPFLCSIFFEIIIFTWGFFIPLRQPPALLFINFWGPPATLFTKMDNLPFLNPSLCLSVWGPVSLWEALAVTCLRRHILSWHTIFYTYKPGLSVKGLPLCESPGLSTVGLASLSEVYSFW